MQIIEVKNVDNEEYCDEILDQLQQHLCICIAVARCIQKMTIV